MPPGINARYNITEAQVQACAGKITEQHFEVLRASLTLPYSGIAKELNIKVGTVRSRLNRARAALNKIQQEFTNGESRS